MRTHPLLIWFTAAPQPIAVPAAFSEHCWRLSIWQTACAVLHFAALHWQLPVRILHPKPAHLQSRRYELTRNWCTAAPYFVGVRGVFLTATLTAARIVTE